MSIGLAACKMSSRTSIASKLLETLPRISFNGTTGVLDFDTQLDRRNEYLVLQNVRTRGVVSSLFSVQVVAAVIGANWTLNMSAAEFSDGTNTLPVDIEPPTPIVDRLPLGAKAWGVVEALLAILCSLGMLVYLLRHRENQAFVESQPIFMFLIALGCTVMGVSIFGLVIESDAGCMVFPVLFPLGFVLVLASVIAKSARVATLWYSRAPLRLRRHKTRAQYYLSGVFASVLGLAVLLVAWLVCAPLTFAIQTTQRDAMGYPLYSSAMCVIGQPLTSVFLALVITYVCAMVFITMICSYWVRNAPEKFQEAKMTAIAGISVFQVFVVGIPTCAAVWNMALPRFLGLSSFTMLLCLIALGTMFLPKIFRERFGIERSSEIKNKEEELRGREGNDERAWDSPTANSVLRRRTTPRTTTSGGNVQHSSRTRVKFASDVKGILDSIPESDQAPPGGEIDSSSPAVMMHSGSACPSDDEASGDQYCAQSSNRIAYERNYLIGSPTNNSSETYDTLLFT
jgi:hypothetical protein